MNSPEISIIVPIYNAGNYLKRCVDSIIAQTFEDIQIILIDDGSTDSSPNICEEYIGKDKRIIFIHIPNSGVSVARNTGLNIAEGKYIGFVDADDYIEHDMYEIMHSIIEETGSDICCCGYFTEDSKHIIEKHSPGKIIYNNSNEIFMAVLRQDVETGVGSGNWNKLFKTDAIKNVRYCSSYAYAEDVDFQINAIKNISRMVCIPDIKYHYIHNEYSASKSEFNKKYTYVLKVSDNILDYVINSNINIQSDVILCAYAFHLTWYIVVLQKIYDSDNKNKFGSNDDYICQIRQTIKKNFKYYFGNKYAKRLDKYYMYALIFHCMPAAILLRKIVIKIRKVFFYA